MTSTAEDPIVFDRVSKIFEKQGGEEFYACKEVSFKIRQNEIVAIVGETGCGKSTALSLLLGLNKPSDGTVSVLGRDPFNQFNSLRGAIGIIFQNDRLLPWRTARDNVAFGLEVLRVPKEAREKTAEEWLERVGLGRFVHAYPHELSGGMRQRVSIARTFAIQPKILLADEAFSALDELTAAEVRKDLLNLIRETETTTVFITHSVGEAVSVAERVLVFGRPGRVVREIAIRQEAAKNAPREDLERMVRDGLREARDAGDAAGPPAAAPAVQRIRRVR